MKPEQSVDFRDLDNIFDKDHSTLSDRVLWLFFLLDQI